eukprot:Nitzschia sp. Nitz4//scaffold322_size40381//31915//33057//NITZ4_007568-RA/size40381-processed-gene-0.36-mRNA-1//1//CDS//3329547851//2967//frame0
MFANSSKAKPIKAPLSRKKTSRSMSLGTSPSESYSLPVLDSSTSALRSAQKEFPVIQVASTGKTLPSAKNLLTQKPPFDDSTIIRLSDNLISSPNTVVTGYFRVRSKFSPEKYDGWMKNMLSLQDPMIIFTHADVIDQIKQLRSHALDRTVIVPLDIDQLPYGTLYSKEFWQDQLERDPEIKRHKSYELFWIWLSKSYLVSQAIRLNVFQSDLFMWSDIGCFRDNAFNSKTMIQHREMVPPHEMVQMAHHKPNPPKEDLYNDKYQHKDNFYHSGSQFVAFKDTWIQFHQYFLEIIDAFLEKNMIIVEDQAVLQSVCLSHPEICAYVPFNQVNDNHYFGLRHVLHNGGEYKYWRYKKEG